MRVLPSIWNTYKGAYGITSDKEFSLPKALQGDRTWDLSIPSSTPLNRSTTDPYNYNELLSIYFKTRNKVKENDKELFYSLSWKTCMILVRCIPNHY